jgi:hypothetical protein
VTSDLDPEIQRADHRQGGGGTRGNREPVSNSFVLKILTPKPLGLKILRGIFAKPAPDKAFHGLVGEGYPPMRPELPFRNQFRKAQEDSEDSFFHGFPQTAR